MTVKGPPVANKSSNYINPGHTEFNLGNVKIYFHFLSLFNSDMVHVIDCVLVMEDIDLVILHIENHGCWCPGDARSQDILILMECSCCFRTRMANTRSQKQNGRHFADDMQFQMDSTREIVCVLIKDWLKFVPNGPVGNTSALVLVMACSRTQRNPADTQRKI